jgi:hypothetical protein
MANIKINDITPAGIDLFSGDEGFLQELNDIHIIVNVKGGTWVNRSGMTRREPPLPQPTVITTPPIKIIGG